MGFGINQYLLILTGLACLMVGAAFQNRGHHKPALYFLLLFSFLAFTLMASLDPFLNIWDERFHALVAKNMMDNPFKPMLYSNPIVEIAYNNWDRYHIWLHKQPLFLWQAALSFKLFGVSEFSLRIPNIVMGTALVYATYRTGRLLVNPNTGYLAGMLIVSCYFILNLASGRQAVDHCDFALLAYVSLSVWTYTEFCFSGRRKWLLLTGLFAGMAVLCKWLLGLLVYLAWMLVNLQKDGIRRIFNHDFRNALAITLLIALPWQIYVFMRFPQEALNAYLFNVRHVSEPLDGQGGTFLFHFERFDLLYGALSSFIIVPGFMLLWRLTTQRKLVVSMIASVVFVYLFFSVATTKMPAYPVFVAMPIFVSFAALLEYLRQQLQGLNVSQRIRVMVFVAIVGGFVLLRFDFASFREQHADWENEHSYSAMLLHNREVFRYLKLPDNTVIFNVRGRHFIEAMFYTGLPAYKIIPDEKQYLDLKEKGYRIALFQTAELELPAWLANDPAVIVIKNSLKGYD